jgi:hypothetical protein
MEPGRNQLQHLEECEGELEIRPENNDAHAASADRNSDRKAGLVADHDADVGPGIWIYLRSIQRVRLAYAKPFLGVGVPL